MKNWAFKATMWGETFNIEVQPAYYAGNGRPALDLVSDMDGFWDLYGPLTVNVPGIMLEDEQRDVIIDHNLSREMLQQVIDSGLLEPKPVMSVQFGMATSEVYRLTDKAMAIFGS